MKDGRIISISKKDIGTSAQYNRDVINKLPSLGGEKIQVDAGGKVPDIGKFYNDISQRYTGKKIDPNKINRNIPGTRANDLKNIEKSINEDESKNPYLDSKGRDKGGVYGQNPPIPKGYPRGIMDSDDVKLKNKYFREKDVMDYFRNQGNKIKQTFETSKGPITKEYSNPFVNQKASQSKRLPPG